MKGGPDRPFVVSQKAGYASLLLIELTMELAVDVLVDGERKDLDVVKAERAADDRCDLPPQAFLDFGKQAVSERYVGPVRAKPLVAVSILLLHGIERVGIVGNPVKPALQKIQVPIRVVRRSENPIAEYAD